MKKVLSNSAKKGLYLPQHEHDSCGIGFVANIKGGKSHKIVEDALKILIRMEHRGATGSEENSGDGAGVLTQIPHDFFQRECGKLHIELPEPKNYAVGMVFLPTDKASRAFCEQTLERIIGEEGQKFLGWRDVPFDNRTLGATSLNSQPFIKQIFIGKGENINDDGQFDRKLFVIRRWAKELITRENADLAEQFYFASLSTKTIIYKGMLTTTQLSSFYPDLHDAQFQSALAVVHSRFSTNTFPSWSRAQPLRYIAHNGEINTLRGNINWMNARESNLKSTLFGEDSPKVLHVIDADASDSGAFDNSLETLTLAGRSLPHSVMMMIPEPLSAENEMSAEKRAFYEYHACLLEPWDGPAAITFTDGEIIGAVLDRNGLRPSRYYVTKDDVVIMASEVGVLEIEPSEVVQKGRLQPGKMFLIDTREGRIIPDEEIKHKIATELPYQVWLKQNLLHINDLPPPPFVHEVVHETVVQRQRAFGYTEEELRMLIAPMATDGAEAVGSMGNDTPLAVFSRKPQLLYNYFKQLFAQVTNPPIDAIREELVTSIDTAIGRDENLFEPTAKAAHQIKLNSFVLTNEELEKLRLLGDSESAWGKTGFKSITLPMLFDKQHGTQGLEWALEKLCHQAGAAVADGYDIFILSDREMDENRVPIPALLAVSAVNNYLIREGTRTQVGFVLESGEPREVHHFALLLGYGATAINPYLAFETIHDQIKAGAFEIEPAAADKKYVKAVNKGVVKVLSKIGISTIRSYLGAQLFEILGIGAAVVEKYFTGTVSRLGGIGLDEIAQEAIVRHEQAFAPNHDADSLEVGGNYQWRQTGETHLFNPQTIHSLQRACRTGDYEIFKQFSRLVNEQEKNLVTLRSLLRFKKSRSIPIEEVESVEEILKRFKTGAMSYGSISKEAHESLAIAMNRLGGKSNTGEGGEDAERYEFTPNGDSKKSAIKQVASGRFGVTSHYLVNAVEIQIKMAQGAKPGEGGQLPGSKVYPWIAKTRYSTPGVGLISPPPHHDIYSIEDLKQLIFDLKNANEKARISVKLVAEAGVGTVAAGVAKAKADVILISGHDGGTGASPLTSLKHAGIPWEIGLAEAHQTLLLNNLRSRVRLETDGQMKTGRDVIIAALLGAEEFGFSTAPLVSLGCIMMRVCHLNTCPVGVATQDPQLRAKFSGDPNFVVNFMRFVAQETRETMAELGVRSINALVGRTDYLEVDETIEHWKAKHLDLSPLLHRPEVPAHYGRFQQIEQNHELEKTLDKTVLLDLCRPALESGERVFAELNVQNTDRAVGTVLGGEISKRFGAEGLPDDTIRLKFKGSAGQSFGAFLSKGVTLTLEGDSNDYVGKGLSGGKIVVFPAKDSTFPACENIIVGNTVLYGATGGRAFISGVAGERFAVRNSGANAVVEGVGDHGCEYMTGGRVVILGQTGKNFAAGMSGGIAYIYDETEDFWRLCNQEMVSLTQIEESEEIEFVRNLIAQHFELTESVRAQEFLRNWQSVLQKFVRVIPNDYRQVIEAQKRLLSTGLSVEKAEMLAFTEKLAA
jgi:glutamate synthase domain-containing protein 2/glutamate synthase domain-containing protein 1/glutamate synthase domain-containing protein 3